MTEDVKHPIKVTDGEFDELIGHYIGNMGATRTPCVVLESSSGKQVVIKPDGRNTVVVDDA